MISSWRFLLNRVLTHSILTSRSDEPPFNSSDQKRGTVISGVFACILFERSTLNSCSQHAPWVSTRPETWVRPKLLDIAKTFELSQDFAFDRSHRRSEVTICCRFIGGKVPHVMSGGEVLRKCSPVCSG